MSVVARPEEDDVSSAEEMPAETPKAPPDLANVSYHSFPCIVTETYADA